MTLAEQLTAPWPADQVLAPDETWIEGGNLCWKSDPFRLQADDPFQRGYHRPDVFLLEKFVALATASDEEIAEFADRFGTLHLCKKHRMPFTHGPGKRLKAVVADAVTGEIYDPNFIPQAGFDNRCPLTVKESPEHRWHYSEPLDRWRHYAAKARAILTIAGILHAGGTGKVEDWQSLFGPDADMIPDLITARWLIIGQVEGWMRTASVHPSLWWFDDRVDVVFGNGTLFGALAVQLLSAVSKHAAPAICSECGQLYSPMRRPRGDRRNFCPECRCAGVPQKLAKRTERERKARQRGTSGRHRKA